MMNFLSSEIVLMYELFFFPAIEILISYSFNKTYNSTFANIIKEVGRLYLGAWFLHCFKPYTIRQARFLVCVFFWCQCVVLIFFLFFFIILYLYGIIWTMNVYRFRLTKYMVRQSNVLSEYYLQTNKKNCWNSIATNYNATYWNRIIGII